MLKTLLRKLLVATMATVLAFGGAGMSAAGQGAGAAAPTAIDRDAAAPGMVGHAGCAGHEDAGAPAKAGDCCKVLCHIAIMSPAPSAATPEAFGLPQPTLRSAALVAVAPHRLDRPPKR